jgi:hypothetical protein
VQEAQHRFMRCMYVCRLYIGRIRMDIDNPGYHLDKTCKASNVSML